jgi:hypothetical protein
MSVYFATAGDYLKIGYSADPAGRMNTVTRNGKRPDDLPWGARVKLIGWIPGDRGRERSLHDVHASHRVAGEWFRLGPDAIREHIWADPRGIDVERMTAATVFALRAYPHLTRDDLAERGVQIEATPESVVPLAWMDGLLDSNKGAAS